MSGRVVHFELPADDVKRAGEFYQTVFGWDINPVPDVNYVLVVTTPSGETGPTEPGAINGGMAERSSPITAPVITIEVDEISRALEQVEAAGGAVVQGKQPVGAMGFTAYFSDTEGNVVGLWQNAL
ncbi:MAG: VOC family protein [Micromonosporaceae bacterium]